MNTDPHHLQWDACLNVRDLGRFVTREGHTTRWRAVVRSDTELADVGRIAIPQLTPEFWRAWLGTMTGHEGDLLTQTLDALDELYGGIERYLVDCGFEADDIARVRDRILE